MGQTRIARFALRPPSVVVAGVVNQPSPPALARRSFLKALAIAPLAPIPALVAPTIRITEDYEVDFDVFKPCDFHFDVWEQDETGFTLEIYDLTHKRGYQGYIRWWAIQSFEDKNPRQSAYATGLAKLTIPEGSVHDDGIVTVRFAG